MIRYFYCLCFLVGGMGLPLLAKSTATSDLTPSSSGKGTKSVPSPASSADAAESKAKKREVTVISDRSRAELSAAALAADPRAPKPVSKPAPTQVAATESHIEKKIVAPKSQAKVATTTTSISKPTVAKSSTATSAAIPAPMAFSRQPVASSEPDTDQRLARVTAYWAGEGDYYTGRCISATGVRLHDGHCAVDPSIIPYGSVVSIEGVGKFLAVDTGSAVISRTAARESGHNSAERAAIVVDVFFEDAREGERFAAAAAKFVRITWWTPHSLASEAAAAGGLFADENWTKIQSKQL